MARQDGKHDAMAMDGAMASQRLGKVRQLLNGPRAQRGWTAMDGNGRRYGNLTVMMESAV
jgi:hypothetical protein